MVEEARTVPDTHPATEGTTFTIENGSNHDQSRIQLVRSLADKPYRGLPEGHKFIGGAVPLRPARPKIFARKGLFEGGLKSRNNVFA